MGDLWAEMMTLRERSPRLPPRRIWVLCLGAALVFLTLFSFFLAHRLSWVAGSDSVIAVCGGTNTSDFFEVLDHLTSFGRIRHVVESVDFLEVTWNQGSQSCTLRGLVIEQPETWWRFEAPIHGQIPRRDDEAIASKGWIDKRGIELGEKVVLGRETVVIVASVEAGGAQELNATNRTVEPPQLYFLSNRMIPRIIQSLPPDIDSFTYACHVRIRVFPSRYVEEVCAKVKEKWSGFDFIPTFEPSRPTLRQPALSSIRILKASILLVGLAGMMIILSATHRPLIVVCSAWAGALALTGFLALYTELAPSRFIRLVPAADMPWIIGFTSLVTLCLCALRIFEALKRREQSKYKKSP